MATQRVKDIKDVDFSLHGSSRDVTGTNAALKYIACILMIACVLTAKTDQNGMLDLGQRNR